MTYYARELTDPAGGALTITTDHQGLWITATEGREEVTVGPFPATTLADDMDGGVTAALIEQEVAGSYTRTDEGADLRFAAEQIAEAQAEATAAVTAKEKAEQERDEVGEMAASLRSQLAEALDRTTQPHPLTADDITDEMVRRGHAALVAQTGRPQSVAAVEAVLTAALTEPTRPEGLATLIDTIREATYDPEPEATGEALYNAGVRVVTEEQA